MRVAIVGGGIAGLLTAWLLQDGHEVMLFEESPRLGGHARTIDVVHGGREVAIDVAAEFFGTADTYPLFHRLLQLLSVPTRSFAATATVHGSTGERKLVLPPWGRRGIDWSALTLTGIADFVRFGAFSIAVARSGEEALRQETIGRFLARACSGEFGSHLIEPFLLGQFGMPRPAFDDCLAYDILKYCSLAGPIRLSAPAMTEIVGGTRRYINAMAGTIGGKSLATATRVDGVTVRGSGLELVCAGGQRYDADHLVLATRVVDVARLYPIGPSADVLRNVVNSVDTFEAELAIHGDESVMPADRKSWSVANFRRTAQGSALTVWKPWLSPVPLFRSWVLQGDRILRNEYGRFRFRHPIGNSKYYAVQGAIKSLQGRNNIWFAGSYVHDNDCHESAVASAVDVARRLAPESRRLRQLLA